MKTPEYYGAVGDGITDDTAAWQLAVDSGEDVKAMSSIYKCGKITVSHDVSIDCGNAEFIALDNVLFDCHGSVSKTLENSPYSANQKNWSLPDTFTGIAFITGTNNIFQQRPYYKAGSVEKFVNGVMQTTIPVDVENPTVDELAIITVYIRNIANVTFLDETNAVIIKLQYVAYAIIQNVNMTNLCYSVVQLWQCYGCVYRDSVFDIAQYKEYATNYYPVEILDSCYTQIINVQGHCVGWHCVSTGNHTFCRGTVVDGCSFETEYPVPAYSDHENGIETIIKNTTLISGVLVGINSSIERCVILPSVNGYARVMMHMCNVEHLANVTIKDCSITPSEFGWTNGIFIYCSARETGYAANYYFGKLQVENCTNALPSIPIPIIKSVSIGVTGIKKVDGVLVTNSNFPITCNPDNLCIIE